MSQDSTDVLSLALRCDQHAPATVRQALEAIEELGHLREDARLVASELVSNAVLHSGCTGEDLIQVSARLRSDHLTISVHDPGRSGYGPEPRAADGGEPGGLGLLVVERLARRWGTERPDGRRVWAELALVH